MAGSAGRTLANGADRHPARRRGSDGRRLGVGGYRLAFRRARPDPRPRARCRAPSNSANAAAASRGPRHRGQPSGALVPSHAARAPGTAGRPSLRTPRRPLRKSDSICSVSPSGRFDSVSARCQMHVRLAPAVADRPRLGQRPRRRTAAFGPKSPRFAAFERSVCARSTARNGALLDHVRDLAAALERDLGFAELALAHVRIAKQEVACHDARRGARLLGQVGALRGHRNRAVQVAANGTDSRLADQRIDPGDDVALLAHFGRAPRRRFCLAELAQTRVAHGQRDERERRADEVVLLLEQRRRPVEGRHAFAQVAAEDLEQARSIPSGMAAMNGSSSSCAIRATRSSDCLQLRAARRRRSPRNWRSSARKRWTSASSRRSPSRSASPTSGPRISSPSPSLMKLKPALRAAQLDLDPPTPERLVVIIRARRKQGRCSAVQVECFDERVSVSGELALRRSDTRSPCPSRRPARSASPARRPARPCRSGYRSSSASGRQPGGALFAPASAAIRRRCPAAARGGTGTRARAGAWPAGSVPRASSVSSWRSA